MVAVDRQTLLELGVASTSLRPEISRRSCLCVVTEGPDAGREAVVTTTPLAVGAGAECALLLSDSLISRRHLELSLCADGIRVSDLGSKNGTFHQSVRISEATLPFGATLRLGHTTLHFIERQRPRMSPSDRKRFGGMVGDSRALREVFAILELASPTDATVVLQGESGTGKEVAARAIHDHSQRAHGPLVVLDCSAAKEQLIESDLFGHIKGAFTGAVSNRPGAFVQAAGGTLFLDEIGELPLAAQARLLRALEERTVQPLGSDKSVTVDVRIVAATHRDLAAMVAAGTFRFDLYHRLAVVHVYLPPLRERPGDIEALIRHFYEGRGAAAGDIQGEGLQQLKAYPWPGNVRELRNVLERAWVLSGTTAPRFTDLRLWLTEAPTKTNEPALDTHLPYKEAKEHWLSLFEERYAAAVFELHQKNLTHAALHAGIARRHFRRLLRKHGLIAP